MKFFSCIRWVWNYIWEVPSLVPDPEAELTMPAALELLQEAVNHLVVGQSQPEHLHRQSGAAKARVEQAIGMLHRWERKQQELRERY